MALVFSLLLISCGSGGGNSSSGGGIGGTGFAVFGSITGFGSIVVNGTVVDTSNAVIILEGVEIGVGDQTVMDNLDIGRVVAVEGTVRRNGRSFSADRVTYNDNVEGPVESIRAIDMTTKEIVVLGQTVIVNAITVFKGTTFETIAQNDLIEVSGLVDDTGAIWANFVEKTGEFMPGIMVEVKGFVENLDLDLKTFEINDLKVDYSIADTSGLPGGLPEEDVLVEVEGTLDAAGGEMLATEIDLTDELGIEDVDEIEVIGFVTDFISVFEFTVGTQVVQTDANTLFVDGIPADIALGVKLEAEGRLDGGILFAEAIEFWDPDQIEVEGLVTDFVSIFEFTVGDQVVQTDGATVFEGGMPGEIALGVLLEIKGAMTGDILLADKVSFE
jgi:hypothetical protein